MNNIGMVFFQTASRPASAVFRVYPQIQTDAVLLAFNPDEEHPTPPPSSGRMERRRRMIQAISRGG